MTRRIEIDAEHMRQRVLQDALAEALASYWQRRAEAFDAARPRPGDFNGRATDELLAVRDAELADIAHACRIRATLAPLPDLADEVADALGEVA